MAFIYIVTNTVNRKRYVGQTLMSVADRWRAHCAAAKSKPTCRAFHAAIRKHGPSVFTIDARELPSTSSQQEVDAAEAAAIAEFNTLVPNGYNLLSARGGRGSVHAETKARMRAAHQGRAHSPEHCANIRVALTGKPHPPERVARMRDGRLKAGWNFSPEARFKMGASARGKAQHPNTAASLRAAHVGAKRSAEACARISAGIRAAAQRRAAEHAREQRHRPADQAPAHT